MQIKFPQYKELFEFSINSKCHFWKTSTCRNNCYILGTKEFSEKDIAKSLLHMISNDIGQVSSHISMVSMDFAIVYTTVHVSLTNTPSLV
jgi:pantothenate kinase